MRRFCKRLHGVHMKRFLIAVLAAAFSSPPILALSAPPPNISQTVGVCDPNYPKRCVVVNTDGSINVNGGGGGGGNAAAGPTGSAVPADAGYTGFNVSGNLVGVSSANPLPITATGGSVGLLGGTALVGKVGIDQTTPGTTNGVVVNSSALPTGASTSANQTTEIASLATIATNTSATTAVGVTTCPVVGVNCTQPAAAVISIATNTTSQVVALSSGKLIYVYNFNVLSGGTGNFSFVYGTGTNCATGTTALTGVYNLTAQSGLAPAGGGIPIFTVPASNALCVVDSASVQMSGSVGYVQQ